MARKQRISTSLATLASMFIATLALYSTSQAPAARAIAIALPLAFTSIDRGHSHVAMLANRFAMRAPALRFQRTPAADRGRGDGMHGRGQGGRGQGRGKRLSPLAFAKQYYGKTYDRWNGRGGSDMSQRNRQRRPSISPIKILLGINALVFIAQQAFPAVTFWGVKDTGRVLMQQEYYRLGSAMFLHGDWAHLAMNSFSLYNLGKITEMLFGASKTVAIYLTAGFAGNVLSTYMTPNPSLGASGAIFGLGGACGVWLMKNRGSLNSNGDALLRSLAMNLGINLLFGMSSRVIDNAGHIGGLLGGAAIAMVIAPRINSPRPRRNYY